MLIWNSENTNISLPVSKSKDGFFSAVCAAGERVRVVGAVRTGLSEL